MEQTVTLKIRLYIDATQEKLLDDTMSAYLAACNSISGYIFKTQCLSQSVLNRHLYYGLRQKYGLSAQITQSAIKTVIAAYKSMQSNRHPWHRAVFRHGMADLLWNRDYRFLAKEPVLSVSTIGGRLKLNFSARHCAKYMSMPGIQYGTAKLLKRRGKYYLHVPATVQVPDTNAVTNVVGVDRGTRFLAACYDSSGKTVMFSGKAVKETRLHYARTRKELQQRRTASSRRKLASVGSRENRYMQDVNHCIAKALIDMYPTGTLFVLEDLSHIREATDHGKCRGMYLKTSWGFADLAEKLAYKAAMKGSKVIFVNPAYTSQTCPKCGHVDAGNRNKKMHSFACRSCGYSSNDDRIAAMNLHRLGINMMSTGCSAGCL